MTIKKSLSKINGIKLNMHSFYSLYSHAKYANISSSIIPNSLEKTNYCNNHRILLINSTMSASFQLCREVLTPSLHFSKETRGLKPREFPKKLKYSNFFIFYFFLNKVMAQAVTKTI